VEIRPRPGTLTPHPSHPNRERHNGLGEACPRGEARHWAVLIRLMFKKPAFSRKRPNFPLTTVSISYINSDISKSL